jgi:hypothetical protein
MSRTLIDNIERTIFVGPPAGRNAMRKIFRAAVVAGMLTLQTGAVSAGSGGAGEGGIFPELATALKNICDYLGMTVVCPGKTDGDVIPNIVEMAALSNANPGAVRSQFFGRTILLFPPHATISAINDPILQQFGVGNTSSADLSLSNSGIPLFFGVPPASLQLLAFISGFVPDPRFPASTSAGATLPSDPAADSFFYAVTTGTDGQPNTLNLFFDYLPQTRATFVKGQNLGDITFPLAVLNRDGSERPVTTNLQIRAACTGGPACLTASAVGDFLGTGTVQQRSAANIGLVFKYHFGPSPNSAIPHAIFEVRAPLLVTVANDPAYFGVRKGPSGPVAPTGINQISGYPTAFRSDVRGFSPAFLGSADRLRTRCGFGPVSA